MSDLSSISRALLPLATEIRSLKRGGSKDEQKPHKLFLILAVIDLFEHRQISENRIYFDENLNRSFEKYFRLYSSGDDWCQLAPPFFHLRSSTFWKHKIKTGREEIYSKITTSGGGSKRIKENIEYAYFDEETFTIFSNEQYRHELTSFILGLLATMDNVERISPVFHESLSLSRSSLMQIVNAVQIAPTGMSFTGKAKRDKYFSEHTSLGPNYIKSMLSYCKGAGLLGFDFTLTTFGQKVIINDPLLEQAGTLWLMHYHLSAPYGPGPSFWNEIVTEFYYSGSNFSADDLVEHIGNFIWKTENRILAKRGVKSTATIFLGTYMKPEGLGKLHLLEEVTEGRYSVRAPAVIPVWAVACALLEFWKVQYPGRLGVGLDTLQESGFLKLFLMSKLEFDEVLKNLQEAGYIDVYRTAPPYQVILLRQDQDGLLKKLYGKD